VGVSTGCPDRRLLHLLLQIVLSPLTDYFYNFSSLTRSRAAYVSESGDFSVCTAFLLYLFWLLALENGNQTLHRSGGVYADEASTVLDEIDVFVLFYSRCHSHRLDAL
jgi:hypothetical protein